MDDSIIQAIVKLMAMDLGPEKQQILKSLMEKASYDSSIESGTPSKGGSIKVYVDLDNPESTTRRIKEAVRARNLLNDEILNGVKEG
jgi:hypothetical protein